MATQPLRLTFLSFHALDKDLTVYCVQASGQKVVPFPFRTSDQAKPEGGLPLMEGKLPLQEGAHHIRVNYFEDGGLGVLDVSLRALP